MFWLILKGNIKQQWFQEEQNVYYLLMTNKMSHLHAHIYRTSSILFLLRYANKDILKIYNLLSS